MIYKDIKVIVNLNVSLTKRDLVSYVQMSHVI